MQHENMLKGVQFGSDGPHITHLLFADDSIVFLEATVESLNTLRRVLQDYERASGQKVNLLKSSIFFGDGYSDERKGVLKQAIGVESEALSERYVPRLTNNGGQVEGWMFPIYY
jgi:hypothetical protein